MAEEIKSIFKSRNYWMAFAISFLTLLGYSLSSWLNAISVGESMEYRESALCLSVGGIFFGGFMLLFPFCASGCARNQSGGRAAKRHGALAGDARLGGAVCRRQGGGLDAGGGAGDDRARLRCTR